MDYHFVNKIEIDESLYYKLVNEYMGENRKLFLLLECQLVNVEGMKEIENHHLETITEVCDSDGSCQWMLRLVGGGLMRNILMNYWKTLYTILINYNGVN